jgi:hypothetical protein
VIYAIMLKNPKECCCRTKSEAKAEAEIERMGASRLFCKSAALRAYQSGGGHSRIRHL